MGTGELGSHSPLAYTEDALNPGSFPFSLATGSGRSVQSWRKPSGTHIPLPPSPPVQVAEKSLPAGDVGMGQLLPHPIKLPLHHPESREETTRAALLGCMRSAPLGDAWHRTPVAPWLPGAALPLIFSLRTSPSLLLSFLLPPFSVSPSGPLPRPSPGIPCLLSLPLPWTPFSCSLSFSELPSSSGRPSTADQVRAVQGSCSALCSCHHPTSINNFSPALKGKYYYSKHVTRQDKHTPLPSPSEGPTLCFLLSVSARVVFPRLALPTTSCAAGQPVAMPAGRVAHTGCLMYTLPYLVTQTLPTLFGHLSVVVVEAPTSSPHRDMSPSSGQKEEGKQQSHPCNPFCAPPPRFPSLPSPKLSRATAKLRPRAVASCPGEAPFLPAPLPLAGLLRAGRLGQAQSNSACAQLHGDHKLPVPRLGCCLLSAELHQGSACFFFFSV